MSSKRESRAAVGWRLLLFLSVLLVSVVVSPFVVLFSAPLSEHLPDGIGCFTNWLFFWPQTALAYYGVSRVEGSKYVSEPYLIGGLNFLIAAAFWLVIGSMVSWALRRQKLFVTGLATIPVAFLAAWLANVALWLCGFEMRYDGP